MLFSIGVCVFENVGGSYEPVKNDIRCYSNVRSIQWFGRTILLCISAVNMKDVKVMFCPLAGVIVACIGALLG